jgi:hypothetical protein
VCGDGVALVGREPLQPRLCDRRLPERIDAVDVGVVEVQPLHPEPAPRAALGCRAPLGVGELVGRDPVQPRHRIALLGAEAAAARESGGEGLGGRVRRELGLLLLHPRRCDHD